MHELSISYALLETALEALHGVEFEGVESVTVEVGELAGVAEDALRFCFPVAIEGTPLAGAALHVQRVPVRVHCALCGASEALPDVRCFRCPRCGKPTADIVSGREFTLKAIALRVPTDSLTEEEHEHHAHSGIAS